MALPDHAPGTGRERIIGTAIAHFGAHGYTGSSLKAIAGDAGVSQALIVHHFGSKAGLRDACDQRVLGDIRSRRRQTLSRGQTIDLSAALRAVDLEPTEMRYLARALQDGSERFDHLVDAMVADTQAYLEAGEGSGLITTTPDPYARAVVLTVWTLGALSLHRHVDRLLGVDLLDPDADKTAFLMPVLQIYRDGLVAGQIVEGAGDETERPRTGP